MRIRLIIAYMVLISAGSACHDTTAQQRDKKTVLRYLSELPKKDHGRLVSGQFESWGSAVKPLDDAENNLNVVHQQTGKWVGLVGAEYHNGRQVNYKPVNQLFEDYWSHGGFCQLYLIMTNPANPNSFNGGGKCDIKSVLNPDHAYHRYFFNELDEVAAGLKELQKKGVVVFLNMFAEATASWFWWGGNAADFIALYRASYDYLVKTKGLDNLLFIFEPSCSDNTAMSFYPGDRYVDMIGFSLFVDYNRELDPANIQNYQALKKLGKPLAISQWGPRRGQDQTGSTDQPPGDNLKLIRGIQQYFPEVVWWMNWNYAYSICTARNSNLNGAELLKHPWVVNREDIQLH